MKPTLTFCAALLLAAASFPSLAASTGNDTSRTFAKTVPAAGLTQIKLNDLVGHVRITTGNTDTVQIHAEAEPGGHGHFIFDWTFGESTNGLPEDLHLVTKQVSGTLLVCLASRQGNGCNFDMDAPAAGTQSGGSDQGKTIVAAPGGDMAIEVGNDNHPGWRADWTLVLPARLALDLTVGVGKAYINGVAGGVHTRIGVGNLEAELPQGPVDANVGVGHINASIASGDYGEVNLTAGVGRVEFDVNGRGNETGYEKHFTSARQQLDGPGKTAYTLKAGVGNVELKLGVKDMPAPDSTDGQGSDAE